LSINLYFIKSLDSQEVENPNRLCVQGMNKQQFRAERSNSNVGTIHNIAYVGSREIVSEEMFMFIRRAATIQLDVASRSLLSKVGQF
jgi:hypothetical protein